MFGTDLNHHNDLSTTKKENDDDTDRTQAAKDGFSGRLHTPSLDVEICIIPAEPQDSENAPDYRIHLDDEHGPEMGAGWKRTGEKAGAYVAVQIDDPAFVSPLRANLFQSNSYETSHILLWNRATQRSEAS